MAKLKRYYSPKTVKVLFTLSGDQCAHPDCTNPVIEPATNLSDAMVAAQICHILAISTAGPRGKAGLTQNELNAPENLVLLCQNHHAVVDGQYESYPADMLRGWKQDHELNMKKRRLSAEVESAQLASFSHSSFPTALVDQQIEVEVDLLRKSRFFVEFDTARSSLALSRRLIEADLCGGTDVVRARALSWCARFLSRTQELDKAEECLAHAKRLGSCPEIEIAEAFIFSQKGDKNAALDALAEIVSPISRSAALMIVANHEGSEGVIDWLKAAGIEVFDLDAEGKYFLLARHLELTQWEAAREVVDALSDQDLDEAPVLHHMSAITRLLSTVPIEYRPDVLNQLPFEAASFPLASDAAAIDSRRTARRKFLDAAKVAQELDCPKAATGEGEYALWLELKDPDESDIGIQRLEARLRDPESALRLVHLGLQFGIKLDLGAVEKEIERQIALHGEITHDAAIARFALAFTQKSPEEVANYVGQHFDELAKHIDPKSMQFLRIEMLSRSGLTERADECLALLLADGLSDAEESRLRGIIAASEGTDLTGARMAQFRQTGSLVDLVNLVDELQDREEWGGLCEYGEILFEKTGSVRDAERLATGLSNERRSERLVEFVEANTGLLAQSNDLRMFYCWSLYLEGELLKSRSELENLSDDRENPNYRALLVNLGIALGDWNSLAAFVANEHSMREKRSAQELIGAAQLGLSIGSPDARALVFAAADKGTDDPGVLAAAYFLAVNAGWEDNPEVANWLLKAAALSGDDGPIEKATLKDVLDRKPEWDRRESETWQLLSRGDIPMFLAARSLNKSLIDMMLVPALANLAESDPRRRSAISAYSAKRRPTTIDVGKTVGMDVSTLLTLGFLNLLDTALDNFPVVHVPQSTLTWLFAEKQEVGFHQPSRIRDARLVLQLLAKDYLEKFVPSTAVDGDLAAQVGDELAALVAEAEKVRDDDDAQRIVVRPAPVHRLASLMEEEADLTEHAAVLSGCLPVLVKLRQKGQLTVEEEKRAIAYLQLHEKPWPDQPEITDGAILYLDDLAVTNFLHLGILGKLQAAGFRPIAPRRYLREANELISYESISGTISDIIERIRLAISSRIESGKIRFGRQRHTDEPNDRAFYEHPTVGVFALADDCDLIISDDRFFNQHTSIDDGTLQAPIFSTLDILETLASAGSMTRDDQLKHATLLRRAGYFFVPLREDELTTYLLASTVKSGTVVEAAELKAVRENILHVRMSNWLQLPKEAVWLDTTLKVLIRVLKSLWSDGADLSSVRARSDWIIDQVDVRGWAQNLGPELGESFAEIGRAAHILLLITPPFDIPQEYRDAYSSWIEDRILDPIKEQYPDLYDWIVEWQRKRISENADMELPEVTQDEQ